MNTIKHIFCKLFGHKYVTIKTEYGRSDGLGTHTRRCVRCGKIKIETK